MIKFHIRVVNFGWVGVWNSNHWNFRHFPTSIPIPWDLRALGVDNGKRPEVNGMKRRKVD